MFHKNLFEILLSRLKVLINTKIFLDDFGLFFKAVLRDENCALGKTFSTRS